VFSNIDELDRNVSESAQRSRQKVQGVEYGLWVEEMRAAVGRNKRRANYQ